MIWKFLFIIEYERNQGKYGFIFRKIEEKNEFISENYNESIKRVPFDIKGISNRTDSFKKKVLTLLTTRYYSVKCQAYVSRKIEKHCMLYDTI